MEAQEVASTMYRQRQIHVNSNEVIETSLGCPAEISKYWVSLKQTFDSGNVFLFLLDSQRLP